MALKKPSNIQLNGLNRHQFAIITVLNKAPPPTKDAEYKEYGSHQKGVKLYKAQHIHREKPFKIGYHIEENLNQDTKKKGTSWVDAISRAIRIINTRCPGIAIKPDDAKEPEHDHHIAFKLGKEGGGCYTRYNVIQYKDITITLDGNWRESSRNGTALHELLHALGFKHTHQRGDAAKNGVQMNEANLKKILGHAWDKKKRQYAPKKDIVGVVPYDPHSIMNYPNHKCVFDWNQQKWTLYAEDSVMKGGKRRDLLSPLDEVAVNLVYGPCDTDTYKPKRSKFTKIHYCGRKGMMVGHNLPKPDMADVCGPDIGPNCGACRVLENDKIPTKNDQGRIVHQGSSGAFYCEDDKGDAFYCQIGYTQGGKTAVDDDFEPFDGYCGPNAGAQCLSCYRLNYLDYIED